MCCSLTRETYHKIRIHKVTLRTWKNSALFHTALIPQQECGISFCAVSLHICSGLHRPFSEQPLPLLCPRQDSAFNPEIC